MKNFFLDLVPLVVNGVFSWPVAVLIIFLCLRQPVIRLLTKLRSVKTPWGELALSESQAAAKRLQSKFGNENDSHVDVQAIEEEPLKVIQRTWNSLETLALQIYVELSRKDSHPGISNTKALAFFEHSGALSLEAQQTLSDLRWVHNQMISNPEKYVSSSVVKDFVSATEFITEQLNAITAFPSVDLCYLTFLVSIYVEQLDKGQSAHISRERVWKHVEDSTIVEFILKNVNDYYRSTTKRILELPADEQNFGDWYTKYLQALSNASGVGLSLSDNGWSLLIAWTNEIIQQGGGWLPREDVAGLHED